MAEQQGGDAFEAFVRKAGSAVTPPAGLHERIRARLDAADAEVRSDLEEQELHAFLDGQLPQAQTEAVNARLASDEAAKTKADSQRAFLNGIKTASGRIAMPDSLRARLAASMDTAAAAKPEPEAPASKAQAARAERIASVAREHQAAAFRRRFVYAALAASVLLVAGLYAFRGHTENCPYLIGCVEQHRAILDGRQKLELQQAGSAELTAYLREKAGAMLTAFPDLAAYNLKPQGAGVAPFTHLPADWGAPSGVFVKFEGPDNEAATLIVHPWTAETPMDSNLVLIGGQKFWFVDHHGYRLATWKMPDGTLMVFTGSRSMDETRKLAVALRARFDSRSARNK